MLPDAWRDPCRTRADSCRAGKLRASGLEGTEVFWVSRCFRPPGGGRLPPGGSLRSRWCVLLAARLEPPSVGSHSHSELLWRCSVSASSFERVSPLIWRQLLITGGSSGPTFTKCRKRPLTGAMPIVTFQSAALWSFRKKQPLPPGLRKFQGQRSGRFSCCER